MYQPQSRVYLIVTMRDGSRHRIPGIVVDEPRDGFFERRNAPAGTRPVPTQLITVVSYWDLPKTQTQDGRTFYKVGEQPLGFLVPRYDHVAELDDLLDASQTPFRRLMAKVEESTFDLQAQRRAQQTRQASEAVAASA